jgi:hypothetical protein
LSSVEKDTTHARRTWIYRRVTRVPLICEARVRGTGQPPLRWKQQSLYDK